MGKFWKMERIQFFINKTAILPILYHKFVSENIKICNLEFEFNKQMKHH